MESPNTPPNPEEYVRRLREIFHEAAAKSTGEAQPKFQRLSDAYDALTDNPYGSSSERFDEMLTEYRTAANELQSSFPRMEVESRRTFLNMMTSIMDLNRDMNGGKPVEDTSAPRQKPAVESKPEPKRSAPRHYKF